MKIKVLKFQKNKIYLENDEIIDINRDIKAKYSIKTGCEITDDDYQNIIYDSALSKSFFLISMRDYTTRDMMQKLKMKYRRTQKVEKRLVEVIKKLTELGYLDDYSYTESYINRKKDLGKKRILFDLSMKGINSSIVNEVYDRSIEEESEIEKIKALLYKVEKKEKEKKIAYLMRRGYKLGDILDVLKGLE